MKLNFALAAAATLLPALPAEAADYVFNLTGTVANASASLNSFTLDLDAADGLAPTQLMVGDTLRFNVSLDQAVLALALGRPYAIVETDVLLDQEIVDPSPFNGDTTSDSSSVNFLNGTFAGQTYNSGQVNYIGAAAVINNPPNFTVQNLNGNITVQNLFDASGNTIMPNVTGFRFAYFLGDAVAAVPEPGTWAMMIGGLGLVGGAMRRRRQSVKANFARA